MQNDYLGHHELVPSWNFVFKDGKRSATAFENCFVTIIYFDQVSSVVRPFKYTRHYKIGLERLVRAAICSGWQNGSN